MSPLMSRVILPAPASPSAPVKSAKTDGDGPSTRKRIWVSFEKKPNPRLGEKNEKVPSKSPFVITPEIDIEGHCGSEAEVKCHFVEI